jgi:hypothetical protein
MREKELHEKCVVLYVRVRGAGRGPRPNPSSERACAFFLRTRPRAANRYRRSRLAPHSWRVARCVLEAEEVPELPGARAQPMTPPPQSSDMAALGLEEGTARPATGDHPGHREAPLQPGASVPRFIFEHPLQQALGRPRSSSASGGRPSLKGACTWRGVCMAPDTCQQCVRMDVHSASRSPWRWRTDACCMLGVVTNWLRCMWGYGHFAMR